MKIVTDAAQMRDPIGRLPRVPKEDEVFAFPVGVALVGDDQTTRMFVRAVAQAAAAAAGSGVTRRPGDRAAAAAETRKGVARGTVAFVASDAASSASGAAAGDRGRAAGAIVAHVVASKLGSAGLPERAFGERGQLPRAPVVVHLKGHDAFGTSADVVLRHPVLGRIEIAVQVAGKRVSLTVTANTRSSGRALMDAEGGIRQVLSDQGFELHEWKIMGGRKGRRDDGGSRFRHLDLEV